MVPLHEPLIGSFIIMQLLAKNLEKQIATKKEEIINRSLVQINETHFQDIPTFTKIGYKNKTKTELMDMQNK